MQIQNSVKTILKNIPSKKVVWLAYSGGMDSHVLLHSVCALRDEFLDLNFKVVHINHGLQPHAAQWALHCDQVCRDLAIDSHIVNVFIDKKPKQSLEALARKARYDAFSVLLQEDDVILTAHHQDDQAETCLLQLFRGAGPRGLASMPAVIPFAKGFLMRPFLSVSREHLMEYAVKHQLQWIDDPSNRDENFTRNFIRFSVMPIIKKSWPKVTRTIARASEHCAEAKTLLDEIAHDDLIKIASQKEGCLSIVALKQLSLSRQKNVLRTWLHEKKFLLPSTLKLQHIMQDVLQASDDANPCVHWNEVEVRRYGDDLYAFNALNEHDASAVFAWNGREPLRLDSGELTAVKTKGQGMKWPQDLVSVRFRQGGEVCRLPKRQGSHTLKKLFQEWRIPPWQRDRIPLIFVDDQLAAIVGYAVCEGFGVEAKEEGVMFLLLYSRHPCESRDPGD